MKTIFLAFTLLLFIGSSFKSWSQSAELLEAYQANNFISEKGDTLPYRILYPEGYAANNKEKYPLILFLHGVGERGSDNAKQLVHIGSFFTKPDVRKNYPAIVVFPQCPESSMWADYRRILKQEDKDPPTAAMSLLLGLHKQLTKNSKVDKSRQYLMGLSMGGFGTYDMLSRLPKTFAAAVPICGGGYTQDVPKYASFTAMWIAHGASDNVVPVENSRRMVEALRKLKADVRYTEFPGVGHNSWDATFKIPELMPWVFEKTK
ncbi:dienelactone hydrolase family protein [Sunxiuqinia sp. A32]|uniref:carboxylesterase family protein n=1 Tax=Sunxiuqinia sp. A32 TaxID=3461496 RepID=UPI0040465A40